MGGVLILLLALAFVYKGPYQNWKAGKGKEKSFLTNFDFGQVNKLEIKKGGKAYSFAMSGDKWQEEGKKTQMVDSKALDDLIEALKKSKDTGLKLVSENKDKQAEFETSPDKGYDVILKKDDNKLLEFAVGKDTSDYSGSYVSETGSDKTYATGNNLSSVLARDDWYDKTVFSADANSINKIRFQFPSREFTVEKKKGKDGAEGAWNGTLPYAFPVAKEKMDDIVKVMSELKAVKIPEQKFAGTGLEKNQMIVEASGDGVNEVLMVGDKSKEGLYYAKRGDSDSIYLISKEDKDKLDRRIADLK